MIKKLTKNLKFKKKDIKPSNNIKKQTSVQSR